MRKWVLLFVMAALIPCAVNAWALPDRVQPSEYSGSQTIKSTGGDVYSIIVNAINVTLGDMVQFLDGGSSGTVRYTCIASTVNWTCRDDFTAAALFNSSIYLKETKQGAGSFKTDVQYF